MLINKNFAKLWLASGATNLADGIALVAFPWIASTLTRDPVAIALIAVFLRAPWFFFALPAGVITDRVDRRMIMTAMDVTRFLAMGVLTFAVFVYGNFSKPVAEDFASSLLALLYFGALLFGMCEVLRDNAAQTILPAVVPKPVLEKANGRLTALEMVLNGFAGPPIAGFLIATALFLPLAVNSVAFLIAALFVFLMYLPKATPQSSFEKNAPPEGFMQALKGGFSWLWRFVLLRDLALILGGVNAAYMMGLAIYVLFAQEVLGLDAAGYGLLLTAGALGGVVGSFVVPWVGKYLKMHSVLLIAMAFMAFENFALGFASDFLMAWILIFVDGVSTVMWNVYTVSFRQRIIPDNYLGRVNSVYRFFGWGMMPVGTLLGGLIVQMSEGYLGREWALRSPFLVAGIFCGLLTIYVATRLTKAKILAAENAIDTRNS